ncbi:putative 2-aminoethylphosphonate ABC transporter permease subunit [Ralstonia solanacearum]|uniref:putative 2-aminoethylphosphonate ABC transporter permease subunit n=1 Tax=Ralstonia solanacearum TaxID=305 RepID=UPI0001816FE8|nr:putative 2-aminoethylphosphonate ABC transporter permease subunit [Ralstonia solanacearum]MDC6180214.1 putative 2-aminoethylphosphonate ABC transporter permease subunit [Ralstonia solanacearum]MDC6212874.1 putative 2-aminoethylphosphonate ABC transporter permease subunit [Ralstonia solanacearum]MDC6241765.1 putative 2-aminoethylphosphonate ABC transporter permease subunit [Ralstonia solanacearum]MDD7801116.1 putative 2-aminoethylphosphonate ABC transporter permease subunit [Ralstonia solanac
MSMLPPETDVAPVTAQARPARTGFRRSDAPLLAGMKLAWLLLLTIGLLLPLAAMLLQATGLVSGARSADEHGLALVAHMLRSPNFLDMVGRTLVVSASVSAIVVPLAFTFAYAVQRTRMPLRGPLRMVAMLPLFAPSLLPGIALVYLFGNQGLFKAWMSGGTLYGFWGIVMGEAFYTFPYALMLLLATLALADGRLYDAARAMGAGPWRTFRTVTLPGARYGLFGAFALVFTLVATDFGVPTVVGGSYQVLAVEAYKAVVGQQQFARGAVIGLLLLVPALLTFGVERLVQRRQHAALASRAQPYHLRPDHVRDGLFLLLSLLLAGWIVLMLATAVGASLVKLWPYNLELSLRHYDFDNMDGGGWLAYRNSLKLAALTTVSGTALIFTGAWLVEKTRATRATAWLHTAIRFAVLLPMAVPGLVLGLGYVFFFNHPANPLHGLYGGMTLLVLCTVLHCATAAHLTAVAALGQLDPVFEAVSASLKVSALRTYWRVTLPMCLPAVLACARYLFVSAMTTVSAVIFLYSPDTVLASVAVLNMDDAGDIGPAAAMSTLILLTSIVVALLLELATRGVVRRTQAWRTTQP